MLVTLLLAPKVLKDQTKQLHLSYTHKFLMPTASIVTVEERGVAFGLSPVTADGPHLVSPP